MSGPAWALLAAAAALLFDQWPGEPPPRWHPVVWMGRYLQRAGRYLQARARTSGADLPSLARGAAAWTLGAAAVLAPACALQWMLQQLPALWAALLLGLLLKPLLALRMLCDEALAVETALQQSLAAGRQQLARIVSRDVAQLDATQVREAAIESLSENLCDAVVAPLLWFAAAGLPGAALYRFADTADCMWGYRGTYRGQTWEWAGKWAARADDALAWLPARITAGALLLAAPRSIARALRTLRRNARQTPSPNSGWPMSAAALALNLRLRKPQAYELHPGGQSAGASHIASAVQLAQRAVCVCLALWAGLLLAWM